LTLLAPCEVTVIGNESEGEGKSEGEGGLLPSWG
jgi:hypothetical protein